MRWNPFLAILILSAVFLMAIPQTIQAAPDEGALIKGLSEKVYVIENGLKRWIKTADIFNKLKYSWANIKIVSEDLLNIVPIGKNITSSYQYPDGTLLKGDAPPVYLIEKALKRWIPNPQIFTANGFKWQNIIQVPDKIIDKVKAGEDVLLNHAYSSNHRPQTFIVDGPCKQFQDTIPEIKTDQIEFKYSGRNSEGSTANLSFETFLDGYDTSWKSSWSSYSRKIKLTNETKTYTFYVRAKTKDGYYDTTPAFCKFAVNLSPYHGEVEIYSARRGWNDNPENEQITIKADRNNTEGINITGWTIKTKKRMPITIPQAVKSVYSNSIYNHKRDLILEPGEKVTIYGETSPIGIDAYKLNKCLKYWDDKLEYDKCRYEHYQDPDFFKKEWAIYLNRTSEFLAKEDEEIILRDKDGLTIDIYRY